MNRLNVASKTRCGSRAVRSLLACTAAIALLLSATPTRADYVTAGRYTLHNGADYGMVAGSTLFWDRWAPGAPVSAATYAYIRPGSRPIAPGDLSAVHALFKSDGTFCADEGHSYTTSADPYHLYKTTDFTQNVRSCGPGYYYLKSWVALRDAQGQYTSWEFQSPYLFMQ